MERISLQEQARFQRRMNFHRSFEWFMQNSTFGKFAIKPTEYQMGQLRLTEIPATAPLQVKFRDLVPGALFRIHHGVNIKINGIWEGANSVDLTSRAAPFYCAPDQMVILMTGELRYSEDRP